MSRTPSQLGRYEIQAVLGKGSMGVVYMARDPLIGRLVALKTFHPDLGGDDEETERFRLRFLREAQSAGILSHPNIVTIHDVVEESEEGVTFIAMEYVQGTNLKEILRYGKPLELVEVVDTVRGVAAALDYAHERGVVHRDVKPANVLLTPERQVKLTDFGIARFDTSNLTHDGQLLGTPNYMSPEQVQGREVNARTDLFSLGVVLYEMVTRHKPFAADSLTAVTHRIVYDDYTPVERYVGGMPEGLRPILDRALAKDPARRYANASEMAEELAEAVRVYERQVALSETQSIEGGAAPAPPPGEERVLGGEGEATVATGSPAVPPPPAPAASPGAGAGDDAPPPPNAPPTAGRRVDWRRVALVGGLAAVLVLVGGWWLTGAVERDAPEVPVATSQERLEAEYLNLLREGMRANRAGDPAAAAVAFRRAASLKPEAERAQRFLRLAEERLALVRASEEQELRLTVRLEAGREALAAGRFQEAASIAAAVLEEDPDNPAAAGLRQRAAAALAREEQQRAAALSREQTAAGAGTGGAEEAPQAQPVPSESFLTIALTVAGEGRLIVEANGRLLADVGYEHFDRVGLFNRKKPYLGETRLERIAVEPGDVQLAYRVEPSRGRARGGEMTADFGPGDTRTLRLDYDNEAEQLAAVLE